MKENIHPGANGRGLVSIEANKESQSYHPLKRDGKPVEVFLVHVTISKEC